MRDGAVWQHRGTVCFSCVDDTIPCVSELRCCAVFLVYHIMESWCRLVLLLGEAEDCCLGLSRRALSQSRLRPKIWKIVKGYRNKVVLNTDVVA